MSAYRFTMAMACLLLLLMIVCGPLAVPQEEQPDSGKTVDFPDAPGKCCVGWHSLSDSSTLDQCVSCHDDCASNLGVSLGSKQFERRSGGSAQSGSLSQFYAAFLLLLASFLDFCVYADTAEEDLEMKVKVKAVWVLICILVISLVLLGLLLHGLLLQRVADSASRKSKLMDGKADDKMPLVDLSESLDEGWMSEVSPGHMGVHLKGQSAKEICGKKWGKSQSSVHAFNTPALCHLFKFRRDQVFRQTCTACPATVNLVSHFASGTYGQLGSTQDLQKEGVRLASFKDFPTTIPVSALRLAQAGFHYTGERDVVKCFSCGETYQGWQMGDRPTLVHARISPNCPFVRGSDTTNLPLPLPVTSRPDFTAARSLDSGYGSRSFSSSSTSLGVPSGGMSNNTANGELHEDSAPSTVADSRSMPPSGPPALGPSSLIAAAAGPIPSSPATAENSMFSGAPLYGCATPMDGGAPRNQPMPTRHLDLGGAVYPLYSQMDARKRSFFTWVADQGLPAVDELITLGFFYAGYADCVRCFFCGIGLKSWEPGDVPAEVHARWRPTCEYLRLVKGDEFVDQVANGGRNVANGETAGRGQGGEAQLQAARRDVAQGPQANSGLSAPSSNGSQPGSAPSAPQVPDIPVVRRARETGYSDEQIAEGIEKLRIIGMERAIEVMLVEVLTNLFRDNPPRPPAQQPDGSGNGSQSGNSSQGGNSDSSPAAPGNGSDLQRDGTELDNEVPDNGPQADDGGILRERQNMLLEENARLRNMRTCQRCHDRPVGVIFLPCGHIIACTTCAPNIRRCLRCDTVIRATANVFFS